VPYQFKRNEARIRKPTDAQRLPGVVIQIEGEFFRELAGGLNDLILENGPPRTAEADRVDSVCTVHSRIEFTTRVMVVRGRRPFFVLQSVSLVSKDEEFLRTLKKYGSRLSQDHPESPVTAAQRS
jgi:hypothetical protein